MALIRLFGQTTIATVKEKLRDALGADVRLYTLEGETADDATRLSQLRSDAAESTNLKIFAHSKVLTIENHFQEHYKVKIDILNPDGELADNNATLGQIRKLYTGQESLPASMSAELKADFEKQLAQAEDLGELQELAGSIAAAGDAEWAKTVFDKAIPEAKTFYQRTNLAKTVLDSLDDADYAYSILQEEIEAAEELEEFIQLALLTGKYFPETTTKLLDKALQEADEYDAYLRIASIAIEDMENEEIGLKALEEAFADSEDSEDFLELAELAAEDLDTYRAFTDKALEKALQLAEESEDFSDLAEFYGEVYQDYEKARQIMEMAMNMAVGYEDWEEILDDVHELHEASPTHFPEELRDIAFSETLFAAQNLAELCALAEMLEEEEIEVEEYHEQLEELIEEASSMLLDFEMEVKDGRLYASGSISQHGFFALDPNTRESLEQALIGNTLYDSIEDLLIDYLAQKPDWMRQIDTEVFLSPLFQKLYEHRYEPLEGLHNIAEKGFIFYNIPETARLQLEDRAIDEPLWGLEGDDVQWMSLEDLPDSVQEVLEERLQNLEIPEGWEKTEDEEELYNAKVSQIGMLHLDAEQVRHIEFEQFLEETPEEERLFVHLEVKGLLEAQLPSEGPLPFGDLCFVSIPEIEDFAQQDIASLGQFIWFQGKECPLHATQQPRIKVQLGGF